MPGTARTSRATPARPTLPLTPRNALVVDGPHLTLVTPRGSASGERDQLRALARRLRASGPTVIVTHLKLEREAAPDLPPQAYPTFVQARPGHTNAVPDGPRHLLSLNATDEQLHELRTLLKGSPLTLTTLTSPIAALARCAALPSVLLHATPDLHGGHVALLTASDPAPLVTLGRLRWEEDAETTISLATEELLQALERDHGQSAASVVLSGGAATYAERIRTGFDWPVVQADGDEVGRAALNPRTTQGLGALELDVRAPSVVKAYLPMIATAALCAAVSAGLLLMTQATQLELNRTQAQIDALTPAVNYVQALKVANDQRQVRLAQTHSLMDARGVIAGDLRALALTLTTRGLGARVMKMSGPQPVTSTFGFGATPPRTFYETTLFAPSRQSAEDTIATLSGGPWRLNVRTLSCTDAGCTLDAQLGTAPADQAGQGATPPPPPA